MIKARLSLILALAGLLAILTTSPLAATHYVSPSGSDSNPGSQNAPWASPAYGAARLNPGDTLVILAGRYRLTDFERDVIRPASGQEGAWVVIQGEEGARPVLACGQNLLCAIDLSGASFVHLKNLEITHDDQASGEAAWFRDGIEILNQPAANIVLEDLYVHHLDEFGLNAADVNGLTITNCRFEYCGFGSLGGPAGSAGGWVNVTITGSSLSYSGHYYQGGDGSSRPYDRPDGFGIEPSAGPILIEQTTAAHNFGDGFDSKAANTTIRRSIAANNSCDGVKLWGGGSRVENCLIYGRGDANPETTPWSAIVIDAESPQASFEIINTTVDDQLGNNYIMHVQYDHPDIPVNLTIRNTIFRGAGPDSPLFIGQASSLSADHNLFYLPQSGFVLTHGEREYTSGNLASLGPGNIYGDPLFIRPAWGEEGDYHLQASSPAINTGTTEGAPAVDLDGQARDASPDIGAYEYVPPAQ